MSILCRYPVDHILITRYPTEKVGHISVVHMKSSGNQAAAESFMSLRVVSFLGQTPPFPDYNNAEAPASPRDDSFRQPTACGTSEPHRCDLPARHFQQRQAGLVRRARTSRRNPADLAGACSGGKFVASKAGEAYDVRARGPKRKFRVSCQNDALT